MASGPKVSNRFFCWIPALVVAHVSLPLVAAESTADSVDVAVFTGPKLKRLPDPHFPKGLEPRSAWAEVNYMVDPNGKAYEISVVDSSGNDAFDEAIVNRVERATFVPAKQGRTPVDGSGEFKITWQSDQGAGASKAFGAAYDALLRAIEASDQPAALVQLTQLGATNLAEDAYVSMGRFYYHRKWGTDAEQLADLRRAVAFEKKPIYLSRSVFVEMLSQMLRLEVNRQDFGTALKTWNALRPLLPAADAARWQPTMDKVDAIRKGNQVVRTPGDLLTRTSWGTELLRNRFEVAVTNGQLAEIKLYCKKRYVFFKYQAGVQYTVDAPGEDDRACHLELIGEPGTQFDLIQS